MAYIQQGNLPNCGAYATAYYMWERQKGDNGFQEVPQDGEDGNVNEIENIFQHIRIGGQGVDEIVNAYKIANQVNGVLDAELNNALVWPAADFGYQELANMSSLIKMYNFMNENAYAAIDFNAEIYMPQNVNNHNDGINLFRAVMLALDNFQNEFINVQIDENIFNQNNACIELVYSNTDVVAEGVLGALHYVLSYRDSASNALYYINPWDGYTKPRAEMGIQHLTPSGAGILLPRA